MSGEFNLMNSPDLGLTELQYSVVIPFFDEEPNVAPLIAELRPVLNRWTVPYEVVLIDDGSRDGTASALRSATRDWEEAKVIQFARNCGQGAALFYGLRNARGQAIVLLDGDGQNDPTDIPLLIDALQSADLVVGVRVQRRDSLLRRSMSRLANGFRQWLLRDGCTDTGCGIKVLRRSTVDALIPMKTLYSFIPTLIVRAGFRMVELPVNHRPRAAGKSKYGLRQMLWRPLFDLFGVWWFCLRRSPQPAVRAMDTADKADERRTAI
jgi:dolichol-phosphate mannosyltransferase